MTAVFLLAFLFVALAATALVAAPLRRRSPRSWLVVLALVPLAAIGIYQALGTPAALDPAKRTPAPAAATADGKVDLASDAARQRFVEQVNDRLTPAEIDDLHRGDAKALERITPNALEQLQLARAYLEGSLMLDELISRRIALDEINEGFAALKRGETIRSVVTFD